MNKKAVIKDIDKTRDNGMRPHVEMLSPEACLAFANLYARDRGAGIKIYSMDQLADYFGVTTDFASRAVKRAVREAKTSFATGLKIRRRSEGNARRNHDFDGGVTPTGKIYEDILLKDRFKALKAEYEKDSATYDALFRNFLIPESYTFKNLMGVYGLSPKEVLYFIMIAAIRDMNDTSYNKFEEIIHYDEFIGQPFYSFYTRYIKTVRSSVKEEREAYLELKEASKKKKNYTDPVFMENYKAAKDRLYNKVAEIFSDTETKIENLCKEIFGEE